MPNQMFKCFSNTLRAVLLLGMTFFLSLSFIFLYSSLGNLRYNAISHSLLFTSIQYCTSVFTKINFIREKIECFYICVCLFFQWTQKQRPELAEQTHTHTQMHIKSTFKLNQKKHFSKCLLFLLIRCREWRRIAFSMFHCRMISVVIHFNNFLHSSCILKQKSNDFEKLRVKMGKTNYEFCKYARR